MAGAMQEDSRCREDGGRSGPVQFALEVSHDFLALTLLSAAAGQMQLMHGMQATAMGCMHSI